MLSKSEQKLGHLRTGSEARSHSNLSLSKLRTPKQDRNILISINGTHNEVNYYH